MELLSTTCQIGGSFGVPQDAETRRFLLADENIPARVPGKTRQAPRHHRVTYCVRKQLRPQDIECRASSPSLEGLRILTKKGTIYGFETWDSDYGYGTISGSTG